MRWRRWRAPSRFSAESAPGVAAMNAAFPTFPSFAAFGAGCFLRWPGTFTSTHSTSTFLPCATPPPRPSNEFDRANDRPGAESADVEMPPMVFVFGPAQPVVKGAPRVGGGAEGGAAVGAAAEVGRHVDDAEGVRRDLRLRDAQPQRRRRQRRHLRRLHVDRLVGEGDLLLLELRRLLLRERRLACGARLGAPLERVAVGLIGPVRLAARHVQCTERVRRVQVGGRASPLFAPATNRRSADRRRSAGSADRHRSAGVRRVVSGDSFFEGRAFHAHLHAMRLREGASLRARERACAREREPAREGERARHNSASQVGQELAADWACLAPPKVAQRSRVSRQYRISCGTF